MAKVESFKEFKFRKTATSKRDQMYLHLQYWGGDADTRHFEDVPLNIKYSEYKEHLPEIYAEIDKYKRLKQVLDCGSYGGSVDYDRNTKRYVIKKYGKPNVAIDDDLQNMIDNVPNEPQTDYDTKCYLDNIILVAYDENGDRHESYV